MNMSEDGIIMKLIEDPDPAAQITRLDVLLLNPAHYSPPDWKALIGGVKFVNNQEKEK